LAQARTYSRDEQDAWLNGAGEGHGDRQSMEDHLRDRLGLLMDDLDETRTSKDRALAASSMLKSRIPDTASPSRQTNGSKSLIAISIVLAVVWAVSMAYLMSETCESERHNVDTASQSQSPTKTP